MANLHVDRDFLQHFEAGLDLRRPERSAIPARVLGQGRVSTVFALGEGIADVGLQTAGGVPLGR